MAAANHAGPPKIEAHSGVQHRNQTATPVVDVDAGADRRLLSGLALGRRHRYADHVAAANPAPLLDGHAPDSTPKAWAGAGMGGGSAPALTLVSLIVAIAPALSWPVRPRNGLPAATLFAPVLDHPG
jgi:hypothetical protein